MSEEHKNNFLALFIKHCLVITLKYGLAVIAIALVVPLFYTGHISDVSKNAALQTITILAGLAVTFLEISSTISDRSYQVIESIKISDFEKIRRPEAFTRRESFILFIILFIASVVLSFIEAGVIQILALSIFGYYFIYLLVQNFPFYMGEKALKRWLKRTLRSRNFVKEGSLKLTSTDIELVSYILDKSSGLIDAFLSNCSKTVNKGNKDKKVNKDERILEALLYVQEQWLNDKRITLEHKNLESQATMNDLYFCRGFKKSIDNIEYIIRVISAIVKSRRDYEDIKIDQLIGTSLYNIGCIINTFDNDIQRDYWEQFKKIILFVIRECHLDKNNKDKIDELRNSRLVYVGIINHLMSKSLFEGDKWFLDKILEICEEESNGFGGLAEYVVYLTLVLYVFSQNKCRESKPAEGQIILKDMQDYVETFIGNSANHTRWWGIMNYLINSRKYWFAIGWPISDLIDLISDSIIILEKIQPDNYTLLKKEDYKLFDKQLFTKWWVKFAILSINAYPYGDYKLDDAINDSSKALLKESFTKDNADYQTIFDMFNFTPAFQEQDISQDLVHDLKVLVGLEKNNPVDN